MATSKKILCLFIFFSFSFLASALASEKGILLTEDIQLKMADAFMGEKEFYRAITEYKKLLILFPDSEKTDYVMYRIGIAYYSGEEYESSLQAFFSLRENFPESQYVPKSLYYEGLSYWKLKRYEDAETSFISLANSYPGSEIAPSALVASSLVFLEEGDSISCLHGLEKVVSQYPEDTRSENAEKAIQLLEQHRTLPQKSQALAAVMSAVIPGSGYIYAEHYGDGITAFLINTLFIAGTITALHQENYAVAAIVGGIGLPFYLGNIYGSANAANKWNVSMKNEVRNKIFVTLEFDF